MKRGLPSTLLSTAVLSIVLLLLGAAAAQAAMPWTDSGGPVSGPGVLSMAYDAGHNLLYAGLDNDRGVWLCTDPDAGPAWTKMSGPTNVGGFEVRALAYDPDRNLLYASAYELGAGTGRGVWRCRDPQSPSRTWAKISGAGNIGSSRISSLAIDAGHNLLFVGLYGAGAHVWRASTPGGTATWSESVTSFPVSTLLYDSSRNTLFAGSDNDSGLLRNDTPGAASWNTWKPLNTAPMNGYDVTSMALDPTRGVLYAGYRNGGTGMGVYRCSSPSGPVPPAPAWSKISSAGNVGDNTIRALYYDNVRNRLYCAPWSTKLGVWRCSNPDGSQSWKDTDGALSGEQVLCLAMTGTRSTLFAGTDSLGVWYAGLANPTWYLAEGSTDWGFDTYISIENPNTSAVTCTVTYMPTGSANMATVVSLPPTSRLSINPRDILGSKDFSTKVQCNENRNIAVDRTMMWPGGTGTVPGAHGSVGVTSPAMAWYLPEGSSDWGFECWLLIQNPGDTDTECRITYMIEGEGPATIAKAVPANSRASFNMADDIGAQDASIYVEGDTPVIAERAMYRNGRREGHDSIGTVSPAMTYYLAEGTTDWGFTTYVLVQNPQATEARVDVTYMTDAGPVAHPENPIIMPATSRRTIRVNDFLPGEDFSTMVEGNVPIIAERAMYWDNGTGEAMHDSIGMDRSHSSFFLPDGEVGADVETWTLVQNPNFVPVDVEVTYMTPGGLGNVTVPATVPANSRMTFNMADAGITGQAAIAVTCNTPDAGIMVERAMYWNARGAGANTIGGFKD